MQETSNLISIITDLHGNIIYSSNNSSPLISLALCDLNVEYYQKKLIANMLDRNYIVYKIKLTIGTQLLVQYFFEEFKAHVLINQKLQNEANKLMTAYKICFNTFSELEQEVIYSLLNGYTTDKCINRFLSDVRPAKIKGNIKYTISNLYNKFSCDNRIDLIRILRYYGFDKNLPKSIFPAGIYDYYS